MIGSILQIAGFAAFTVAAFLVSIPLGLAVGGAALVVIGLWLESLKE